MIVYAVLVALCLILWASIRWPLTVRFVKFLQQSPVPLDDRPLPKAAIVLALRGADPFLTECVQALLQQDYPSYQLQIVVDSMTDPAWQVVAQTLEQHPPTHPGLSVQVRPLATKYSTCSLKCSALIQAISDLASDVQAIAIVDADVVAYPYWLRDLVSPLVNPLVNPLANPLANSDVGATAGYRWYVPQHPQWGAWVRYAWNSLTVAQMSVLPPVFPAGTCCAFTVEAMRRANLLERWRWTLSEDTTMDDAFRTEGITVQPIPWMMMLNAEACDLPSFFTWVQRQLLMPRLYNACCPTMVVGTAFNLSLQLLAIGGLIATIWTHHWMAMTIFALGLAGYELILLVSLLRMEWAVRRAVMRQASPDHPIEIPSWSGLSIVRLAIVLLPTQWIVGIALFLTTRLQQTQWRGITYFIQDASTIHFEYHPYQEPKVVTDRYRSVF